jgi:glycosyltransferase involved in cell wall biosynthesis
VAGERVPVAPAGAFDPPVAQTALSVVLPAFNERESIEGAVRSVLDVLDARGLPGEVIVVDDGSVDDTRGRAARVGDPRVRVLRHETNRGYGAALRTGFEAARHDLVFFTDADRQFDVREITRLLPWAHSYDIVVGYRAPRNDNWLRRFNGWGWNRLVNGLFDIGIRDVDCAFKVFHRRVLDRVRIRSGGAFVNSEILVRATAAGFRVKEVPVSHFPRRSGVATGGNLRVISRACIELGALYGELRQRQREARGASRAESRVASPVG